jgi:hypothetical protein
MRWSLDRFMRLSEESSDNPEDLEPLDRVQSYMKRTIVQVTEISDAISDASHGQEQ